MNDERVESLGYSAILLGDIQACSETFGTELYRTNVQRLRHDVLNMKDGPNLRDIVEEYYSGPWNDGIKKELAEWKQRNPDLREELTIVQDEEEKIRDDHMIQLCDFIRQLLMDNGCIQNYYGGNR